MTSCAPLACERPVLTLARCPRQRGPGTCWYGTRLRTQCSPELGFFEGTVHACFSARFRMHLLRGRWTFLRCRSRTRMMHSEPARGYELRCSTYAAL